MGRILLYKWCRKTCYYSFQTDIIHTISFAEHVDHIMKETIKTNAVGTDKSAIPRQPLLSAAEKKRMQQHYGFISDEEE